MAMHCPRSDDPEVYFGEFIKLMQEANVSMLTLENVCLTLMTSRCPCDDLCVNLLQHPTTHQEAYSRAQQYMSARRKDGNTVNATVPQKAQVQSRPNTNPVVSDTKEVMVRKLAGPYRSSAPDSVKRAIHPNGACKQGAKSNQPPRKRNKENSANAASLTEEQGMLPFVKL